MECYFINETKDNIIEKHQDFLIMLANKTQKLLKIKEKQSVSIIFVDSVRIKEINRDYRGIDKSTDVISFALSDSANDYEWLEDEIELGDIFINVDAVYTQAQEYEHSFKRELCFLFIHGILHTLGFDHQCEEDEKIMNAIQDEILDDEVGR
ncbi:MAG: rRNA maturation RNase YbeY [Anaerorhabdus sp.]